MTFWITAAWRLALACAATLLMHGGAAAQNIVCPTMPPGDRSNACASTAFVQQNAPGVSVLAYGAACDGSTDDSLAFSAAISAQNSIFVPSGKTCIIHDVTLSADQSLDCGGSVLQAPPVAGANQWILRKTGFNSRVRNCQFNDPNGATKHATTLSGAATPGSTTIGVNSATGMQVNQPIAIALDSGAYHLTKITNIAGSTITLADAIPSTQAIAPTVAAGGSNYSVNDHLVAQGGIGPPTIVHVTAVSGGAVMAVAVDAPGLYSTFPTSPVATMDTNNASGSGATLTLTAAGASSGNIVESAWGTLVIDNATEGVVSDVIFSSVPAGLQISNTSGSGSFGAQETVRGAVVNAAQLFAIFKDVGVNNSRFSDIVAYGTTHNASSYGVAGVYISGDNLGAAPTGGNMFRGITMLGFETGWLDNAGQLDFFSAVIGDTIRNYSFVCNHCIGNTFSSDIWMQFTGPNALSGTGGFGGGMYFGNSATNNVLGGLATGNNAFDLHIADATSSIWLNGQAWGSKKAASGFTGALFSGQTIFAATTPASVGGAGATFYLGASGYATTEGAVETAIALTQVVTKFSCLSTGAPGVGQSYTCNLRNNATTLASCSYSGASSFGCEYDGPGVNIFPGYTLDLQVVSSAGAASSQFRAYVSGL
jgi:hypothetical protein